MFAFVELPSQQGREHEHMALGGVCITVSVKQTGVGVHSHRGARGRAEGGESKGQGTVVLLPSQNVLCSQAPARAGRGPPRWSGSLAPEHADVTGEEPRSKRQG